MGSSGHDEPAYSDLHVQNIRATRPTPEGTGDSNTQARDVTYEVLAPQDLENDEIAELVHIHRAASVELNYGDGEPQQEEPGAYHFVGELGINTEAAGEQVTSDQNQEGLDTLTDEVGTLDVFYIGGGTTGFKNNVDALGGGGGGPGTAERDFNFRQAFGTGPYVDAADDLTLRLETGAENVVEQVFGNTYYTLYWDVQRVEGVRPKFGRP